MRTLLLVAGIPLAVPGLCRAGPGEPKEKEADQLRKALEQAQVRLRRLEEVIQSQAKQLAHVRTAAVEEFIAGVAVGCVLVLAVAWYHSRRQIFIQEATSERWSPAAAPPPPGGSAGYRAVPPG